MIHLLLQIFVFQCLFLAVYNLFLKKETFFGLNRIYLLVTPILGCILPFISLDFLQQTVPQEFVQQLPAVVIGANTFETISTNTGTWIPSFLDIYFLGITVSALFFLYKYIKIATLKAVVTIKNNDGTKLKILPNTNTAFSFLNTIYLGENISEANRLKIIAHEKIHLNDKHSLDLLFFEFLKIVFWFNPMVYLFQNQLATLHEYIADAKITAQESKASYYQNLLSEVFQTEKISFINTFFNQSLIKKRISMLQKSKSKKIAQLKYLLLLPVICSMLFYASCSNEPKAEETQTVQQSDSEVMNKINELAEAIMKKGDMTPEEEKALKLLTTPAQPGDKVYTSVQEYLNETADDSDKSFSFSEMEKVPTYPGCEGNNEALKKCFTERISAFVGENFNTKLGSDLGLTGRQRILVQFKIDKSGQIVDVKARAPKPELEVEAVRVVKLLPQMQPGEQKGKKVGVIYSLPIVFDVVE
ncbi:M56 family metallopeptidase [Aequorivita flava]|uniref:M56 family metallopeptidase n=1 Tax=Aequorivita flava TaxID=3114371 RepID=A0AB35YVT6_9FLAO